MLFYGKVRALFFCMDVCVHVLVQSVKHTLTLSCSYMYMHIYVHLRVTDSTRGGSRNDINMCITHIHTYIHMHTNDINMCITRIYTQTI